MLELSDVNTYYGKSHVLFDISMNIEKGEIVGLLRSKRRREDHHVAHHHRPDASRLGLDQV